MAKIREGIGELKFTEADIDKMEAVARTRGEDQYLMLRLWGRRGLRVSEPLGLHKSDIDSKGIWITQKGGERVLKILPPEVYSELTTYSKKFGKTDLLFPITRRTAQNWAQSIAKEAGIVNWERAHPHRWRHFFRNIPSQENGKGPLEGNESDGSQGSPSVSGVREQSKSRGGIGGIVKLDVPRWRFWYLGLGAAVLFYHSYGILSGIYSDLDIVTYDQAIILGVLEALIAPVLAVMFLWKMVVWQHDRPKGLRHVFDDPNILD